MTVGALVSWVVIGIVCAAVIGGLVLAWFKVVNSADSLIGVVFGSIAAGMLLITCGALDEGISSREAQVVLYGFVGVSLALRAVGFILERCTRYRRGHSCD